MLSPWFELKWTKKQLNYAWEKNKAFAKRLVQNVLSREDFKPETDPAYRKHLRVSVITEVSHAMQKWETPMKEMLKYAITLWLHGENPPLMQVWRTRDWGCMLPAKNGMNEPSKNSAILSSKKLAAESTMRNLVELSILRRLDSSWKVWGTWFYLEVTWLYAELRAASSHPVESMSFCNFTWHFGSLLHSGCV